GICSRKLLSHSKAKRPGRFRGVFFCEDVLRERLVFLAEQAGGGDAFAFGHGDGLAGGGIRKPIDLAAGPSDFYGFSSVVVCQAERPNQLARGETAGAAAQHLRLGSSR